MGICCEFSVLPQKTFLPYLLMVITVIVWQNSCIHKVIAISIPPSPLMILDLHYTTSLFTQLSQQWVVTGALTTQTHSQCGSQFLLGGYDILDVSATVARTYNNLPAHNSVFVTLNFWCIDQWQLANYLYVSISNATYESIRVDMGFLVYNGATWPGDACGDSTYKDVTDATLNMQTQHTGSVLKFKIELSNSNGNIAGRGQLGIRNMRILLSNNTVSASAYCMNSQPEGLFQGSRACLCPIHQYSSSSSCQSCHASCGTCSGPTQNDCLSCAAGYTFDGQICMLCDSSCETCFGPSATECSTCSEGKFLSWDGSCRSSCNSGLIEVQSGGFSNCQCSNSNDYYFIGNTSCQASCPTSSFTTEVTSILNICNFKCSSGLYLYQNGSCLATCRTDFIQVDEGGYKYCNFPCSTTEYLYWNGSCSSTCSSPLVQDNGVDYNFCIYPCTQTQYLQSWDGACSSSCNSPLLLRVAGSRNFCDSPCSSGLSMSWDGSCKSICDTGLVSVQSGGLSKCQCSNSNDYYFIGNASCQASCPSSGFTADATHLINMCNFKCSSGLCLYQNGSCLATCRSDFIQVNEGGYKYCNFPCSTTEYLYWNSSCSSTCPSPLVQDNGVDYNFCIYPCTQIQYLQSWDGACSSSCNSPLLLKVEGSRNFCYSPCPTGQSLSWDGSCKSICDTGLISVQATGFKKCQCSSINNYYFIGNTSCQASCPSPAFTVDGTHLINICNFKCSSGLYLYQNGSCLSTCRTYYSQVDEGSYKYCNFPCSANEYLYWNGSCLSICSFPLTQENGTDYRYCIYPCSQSEYLQSWNGSCSSSCQSPYVIRIEGNRTFCDLPCPTSHYLFEDGYCISSCPSPLIKTMNATVDACKRPCPKTSIYYYPDENPHCKSTCAQPYTFNSTDLSMICSLGLSTTEIQQIKSLTSAEATIGDVSQGLVSASVLASSDPAGMTSASLAKIFQYLKFLNITYSARLELIFKSKNITTGFLPHTHPMDGHIEKAFENHAVPLRFAYFKVHSSFIVNFWDGFICLAYVFVSWFLMRVVESLAYHLKIKILPHFIFFKIRALAQNFLITQFYSSYGDIVIFSVLEARSARFDTASSVLSFSVSILFVFLSCIITCIHFLILWSYQRMRNKQSRRESQVRHSSNEAAGALEDFHKKNEGSKVIFLNFKDSSIIQQAVFLFLGVRNMLISLIIAILDQYPLVQVLLITGFTLIIILYLVIKRPFISLISLIQQIVGEIILFVISICLIGLTILDIANSDQVERRAEICQALIMCNMILISVSPIFLIAKFLNAIWDFYQARKLLKQQQQNRQEKLTEANTIALTLENTGIQESQPDISTSVYEMPKIPKISGRRSQRIKSRDQILNLSNFSQGLSPTRMRRDTSTNITMPSQLDTESNMNIEMSMPAIPDQTQKRIKKRQKKRLFSHDSRPSIVSRIGRKESSNINISYGEALDTHASEEI